MFESFLRLYGAPSERKRKCESFVAIGPVYYYPLSSIVAIELDILRCLVKFCFVSLALKFVFVYAFVI